MKQYPIGDPFTVDIEDNSDVVLTNDCYEYVDLAIEPTATTITSTCLRTASGIPGHEVL